MTLFDVVKREAQKRRIPVIPANAGIQIQGFSFSKVPTPGHKNVVFLNLMLRNRPLGIIGTVLLLASCGKEPARLIDAVKEIPLSGGHDTLYMERSSYWDRGGPSVARTDSNRQWVTFKPAKGDVAYVTLRNMGGVPLKRDTIHSAIRLPAEQFLRTGTRDTNMHLAIGFSNPSRPETDVIVFIRNLDSAYREFLFYER